MGEVLDKIKELSLPIITRYQKVLVSLEKVKEYGVSIIRITIDDPSSFDIDVDDVGKINNEILDVVNDLLEDGEYLEVTSVGVERPLVTDDDYSKAIDKYIYVSLYEKTEKEKLKEFYGDLLSYNEESITINAVIKTRRKEIIINRKMIASIRLAVKF